jgi:hypothetical protein
MLFLLLLTCPVFFASAQTAEDSAKMVVNKLFTAMKTSDAALLKSCFADSAILQTFGKDKDGKTIIQNEVVAEFAELVSKQPKGALDERVVFDMVKIDGPLAIIWAPYSFYFNGAFSHCGVDSFQLVKINGEWKIQYLIDTRRKKGCDS